MGAGALAFAASCGGWFLFHLSLARENWLAFPPALSLTFYLLSYLAGGYDVATHALPALLKGKLDTDILMLAAAVGAAILGEWAEGAFLLSSLAWDMRVNTMP